jgi:tRNA-uridine 2-sulfurtransferase
MSGGVDSSLAAALLVEQGYDVIGLMLRLWAEPGPEMSGGPAGSTNKCCSLEAVHDARAVAGRLGMPFYVINAEQPFKASVVDFYIQEYTDGRTPNPCIACNRHIRFGYLLKYARSLGASYLATGHYAQVRRDAAGRYELWRGADPAKDQSYVLHVLGQPELASTMFPVGGYSKTAVRTMAGERGLPTASRAESQDLCFLADGDYRRFLSDWAPEIVRPGPIFDRRGHELGTHSGLPNYTIGQRSGLGVAAPRPLYVLSFDRAQNALVVGPVEELGAVRLTASDVNWISGEPPARPIEAGVQVRYHTKAVPAIITALPSMRVDVRFAEPVRGISPGQAAVFYDGNRCVGGGLIEGTGNGE